MPTYRARSRSTARMAFFDRRSAAGAGTTARARDVSLGGISGNRVAVTAGLEAGERVIVTGASLLTSGDPIRIIPGEGR